MIELATDRDACAKCGGRLAYEQIAKEIDLVCMNCGRRQEAVAKVAVAWSGAVSRVDLENATCAQCGEMYQSFHGRRMYCSKSCANYAKWQRERDQKRAVGNHG